MSSIIVGLDLGTSFIRVVIAEVSDAKVEIIGVAKRPSDGIRNGVIINIEAAMAVIKETIEAAEQMAGVEVTSVYTAIGGAQVESLNQSGQVAIDPSGKHRKLEVTENSKREAIKQSEAVEVALDKQRLHTIIRDYSVDGVEGFKDPIGVMGVRLGVKVHLVFASKTAISNIQQCFTRSMYYLDDVVLKTLACAKATMNEEEMSLGSILIDLGGGTTDVIVFHDGAPVYTASIPVGGNHVTNDIAIVKGISKSTAEKIKVESGCCWVTGTEKDEEVIIPGVGNRPPEETTRYELCQIIQPRIDEILSMVKHEVVHNSNLTKLSGNIILTGGGALMPGIVELTQSVWGTTSVHVGVSGDFGGTDDCYRDPDFATVTGLILCKKDVYKAEKQKRRSGGEEKQGFSLKDFIGKFF